jgi:hypothetical protein
MFAGMYALAWRIAADSSPSPSRTRKSQFLPSASENRRYIMIIMIRPGLSCASVTVTVTPATAVTVNSLL